MTILVDNPSLAIALVIALGASAQWLSWRINLPAILPLLIIGFLIGPVFGWFNPTDFIPQDLLFPMVSLAVGLILFEGGLTLRIAEIREVSGMVARLVSIGALITWLGASAAAYYLTDLPLPLAFLFGALIIVTGPTVIGPLLRIVKPNQRIASVLKWEGILIDAIGAMMAVLVFEFVLIDNRGEALGQTLILLLRFVFLGSATGLVGGSLLGFLLRRRLIPDYLVNVTALSLVFGVFAVANSLAPEAGLLATVLMGTIVANTGVPNISDLLSFKEDLTILFISLLFIVLAANIELGSLLAVLGWSSLALLAVVMLVLRPAAIFASAIGSPLKLNERLYLSWIAPRGIVAAAVSSLFASKLVKAGFEGVEPLVPLVFIIIVGTVLLNSLTAKPLGILLRIAEPDPQGFLILGAHPFARRIGKFLKDEGIQVMLADTNWANVAAARVEGLNAYYGSLLSDHSDDELRLTGIGKLLALTSNDEANALASLKYAREFGSENVYQIEHGRTASERGRLGEEQSGRIILEGVNYNDLEQLFSRGAQLVKTPVPETFDMDELDARYGENYVPLFVLSGKQARLVTDDSTPPEPGTTLVSLVLAPSQEATKA